jgi:hypothetical protein
MMVDRTARVEQEDQCIDLVEITSLLAKLGLLGKHHRSDDRVASDLSRIKAAVES